MHVQGIALVRANGSRSMDSDCSPADVGGSDKTWPQGSRCIVYTAH